MTGYWILDIGYWLLVTGYWLLVTGYWLLVTGYWLLVTGYLELSGFGEFCDLAHVNRIVITLQ